jgi:hypothetical protein
MTVFPSNGERKIKFIFDELVFVNSKSKVFKCRLFDDNSQKYITAIAKAAVDNSSTETIKREINNWRYLDHPNIV